MLSNKKGFTLTEIVVVLVILAILAAFTIPTMLGYISSSQEKLCNVTRMDMTRLYKTSLIGKEASASKAGFEAFAIENWGSLSQCPAGGVYTFNTSLDAEGKIQVEILCSIHESSHMVTADEVIVGIGSWRGYIMKPYSGFAQDVLIPKTLNDTVVREIYQEVFQNKGLTSVTFQNDSGITRIHARAFQNNNLTEIVFPTSLKRIDWGAFDGNKITKITIGSNVEMEGHVFQNNDSFRTFYNAAGNEAGTYIFIAGEGWKKQE